MIVEVQHRDHVQRLAWEDFEQRVRGGEIPPDTLVRFDVVTGEEFRPLGELELFESLVNPAELEFRRRLGRRAMPIVTAALIGIQVRIYASSWMPGTQSWLQEHFTNWSPAVMERGEVWRLISYGLLHVELPHLLFNMLFLAYTGYHLERALGRWNLLLVYFGSVFSGGLLSMAMAPDRPSLGASGGDFGLIAAAVVFGWKHVDAVPEAARKYFGWALTPYMAVSILSGINATLVDNWGHIGGLIGGAALMTVLRPEGLDRGVRQNPWVRRACAGAMLVVAGVLAGFGPRLIPLDGVEDDGLQVERPSYWKGGWSFAGDHGWFSPTQDASLVVTTTVHARPVTAQDAASRLAERVGSAGRNLRVEATQAVPLGKWEAQRVRLHFDLNDEPQLIDALVLARGVFEHRVQFQSTSDAAEHYRPLVERVFRSVAVAPSAEVASAQEKLATHPRSWQPAVQLGDALYRTGDAYEALQAYEHARSLSPHQPRLLIGRLRVYTDYSLPGTQEAAREALALAGDDPDVIVAAVEALESAGAPDEALSVLEAAWTQLPGDSVLRRARLRRRLSVDLPAEP